MISAEFLGDPGFSDSSGSTSVAILPSVLGISRSAPSDPVTTGPSVTYAVTFDEPVTGVSAAAFQVVTTGTVSASPALAVTASGSSYQVTVSGIAGAGTLGLNLVSPTGIVDAYGDELSSASSGMNIVGELYTIAPAVSLAITAPTGTFGEAADVTVSATSAGGTPTGQVTLDVDGVPYTATLANGSATFDLTGLALGSHSLAAAYAAQGGFQAASATGTLQVVDSGTATTLSASVASPVFGQPETFTATVAATVPGAAIPAGSVQFFIDGVASGPPVPLSAGGIATLKTSSLAVGPHVVSADFADAEGPSSGGQVAVAVAPDATALALTASAPSIVYGGPEAYTATVSVLAPGTAAPAGSVQFFIDGDPAGTPVPIDASGRATFAPSAALHAGPHRVSASFEPGSGAIDASDDFASPVIVTVTPAMLTITAAAESKVYGAALPALGVAYSGFVNGDSATSLSAAPVATTQATASSPVGTYVIAVSGAVDPNYTFTYVSSLLTVTPAMLTITANDASRVAGGADPTLTASYSGFVNGDGLGSLGGALIIVDGIAPSAAPGYYPGALVPSGLTSTNYAITFDAGALTITPAATLAASVSGAVFLDVNASGSLAASDPGLGDRTVFVDLRGDGTLDPGDPVATTQSNGSYTLSLPVPGRYAVRLVAFPGEESTGAGFSIVVATTSGQAVAGVNFGLQQASTVVPVPVVAAPFGPAPAADLNTAIVRGLYHEILGRAADPAGLAAWVSSLNSRALTVAQVAASFYRSAEYDTRVVESYYSTFLGRASDPSGLSYWVSEMQAGMTEVQVVSAFIAAEDGLVEPSDSAFVESLYSEILGRSAASSEVSAWDQALGSGVSRASAASDFLGSTEALSRAVSDDYVAFLGRVPQPSEVAAWDAALSGGLLSLDQVAEDILGSPEFSARAAKSL